MTERVVFEIVLPVVMLILGWVTNAYRNKQKKEKDILDNVQQVIDIQNAHIAQCKDELKEMRAERDFERAERKKLEEKYDHKVRAVKEAYDCEGDTSKCPVLAYDKDHHLCETCELRNPDCQND